MNNSNNASLIQDGAAGSHMVNNSFTAGPNSTASRFYNSNKHNRFLSNYNSNVGKNANIPIF